MVKKLYKHELASLFRVVLPIGIICVLFALAVSANSMIFGNDKDVQTSEFLGIAQAMIIFVCVMLFSALVIITGITVIKRFKSSMYSTEGYLTHTIPIETYKIYICKFVCGAVAFLTSLLFVCVCVGIILYVNFLKYGSFDLSLFEMYYGYVNTELVILCVISYLTGILRLIAIIFAAITLGHLSKKHKNGMAVVWYMVITTAINTIGNVVNTVLSAIGYFNTGSSASFLLSSSGVTVSIVFAILFDIVYILVCSLISISVIKNKLNLE